MLPDSGLVAISLFSGAGGLDLGVEQAGFTVAAAVEVDEDAAATMEKNFSGLASAVLRQDLSEVPTRELLRAAGLRGRERPALLVGGPPCVAFSKSGFWLDWKRAGLDPKAGLLQTYARVLAEAKPAAFILENVAALSYDNRVSRPAWRGLAQAIEDAGYQWRAGVLNAADYGVPQSRQRFFVVGVPRGRPLPELPAPTHCGMGEERLPQHVTAGEALHGLVRGPEPEEVVRGRWAHLVPQVPPGDNYLFFTARRGCCQPVFEWRSRYWNFLLKLSPNSPSATIQAQPGPNVGPFHWEDRRLRVGELKRLFTFPDDFVFIGSRRSTQRQVGNAVPPLLARRVAEAVMSAVPAPA